jgi:wolfamin
LLVLDADPTRQIQGINYLKKAAEQGHEMALEYLSACYRTKIGISAANECEVRIFLQMSPAERSARRAARELFNSLCNGNDYVTVEQLEKRMREIYKLQKRKKKPNDDDEELQQREDNNGDVLVKDHDINNSAASSSSSPFRYQASRLRYQDEDDNHISEANLINAAKNYSNGLIPYINQALTLSVPHPLSLEHVPFLHRPFFHPTVFFSLLYHRFIEILSSFPSENLRRYQVLIALILYAVLSTTNNLSTSLPTFGFYLTLFFMVISTFKMLKSKHSFIDYRIWSNLFLAYNENVYADDSENLFIKNNLRPYLWFFLSFAANLMIYPLIADQWLPSSEITMLSFSLVFITMIIFMHTTSRLPDFTILFSFALNVLARYPYELDAVVSSKWRFLDLRIPGLSSFMIGSGIEFTMNCRGLLYVGILFFMFILAKRRNWNGIFQFLFPHCVTLAWLQISIINSQSATTFGLMRSALGLAGIFFFLPIFGLATLLIPVLAAVDLLSVSDSTKKIFITLSTSIIAIVASCFLAISNRTGKYVTYVHILICVLASCFLLRPTLLVDDANASNKNFYSSYIQDATQAAKGIIESIDDNAELLSWNSYYNYCLSPPANRISTQIRCNHLNGQNIKWDGVVDNVHISKISNWQLNLLDNYFPEFIANILTCYFGEMNQSNCFEGEANCDVGNFIEGQKRCNLDKYNM